MTVKPFAYEPHGFERLLCGLCIGGKRHCKRVKDDIFFIDAVFFRFFQNIFGNRQPAFGGRGDSAVVERERDNDAAVFLHKREDPVHALFFAVYGVYERFAVISAQGGFHCGYVRRVYRQRKIGHFLQLAHGGPEHIRFVDIRQTDVYVEHVDALFRLGDALV